MGVYIKDMSNPKSCKECPFKTCFIRVNIKSYTCLINGSECGKTDCPLIEIDLVRCGECEYADEYNHCKYSAWWNGNADFCSHGIRRKESR